MARSILGSGSQGPIVIYIHVLIKVSAKSGLLKICADSSVIRS